MTNAERFRNIFGIYATELWAMSEPEFLEWLNTEAEALSIEPRWIPVAERLPEEEKDVLITLDGGLVSVGFYTYCAWTEESKVEWFSDDFMVDAVAWMPLPEPWKGADDEQS